MCNAIIYYWHKSEYIVINLNIGAKNVLLLCETWILTYILVGLCNAYQAIHIPLSGIV